jgi:hypothetical protein
MQIQPKAPTTKNSAEQFTGDVYLDIISTPQTEQQQTVVAKVRFMPGARTAWHSHANGQTLHVTEGLAWMGTRDGTIIEVQPRPCTHRPMRSTGTAQPRPTTWSTSPSWRTATIPPRPPPGSNMSPTRTTAVPSPFSRP